MIKNRIKRNLVFVLTSLFVVNSIVPSVGFAETGLVKNKNILSRIVNKVGEKKDKLKCFVREHAKAIVYSTVGLGLLGASASFNVKQQEKIKKLEEERDSLQKLNVANKTLEEIFIAINKYGQELKKVQQKYDEASSKINECISKKNEELNVLEERRKAKLAEIQYQARFEAYRKLEHSRTLQLAPIRAIIESPEVTVESDKNKKKIKVEKYKAFQIDVEVAESKYISIKEFAFRNSEISQKLVNKYLNHGDMLNLVSDLVNEANKSIKEKNKQKKQIDNDINRLTEQMQKQNGEKERGEIEQLKEQLKKLSPTEEASSDPTPEYTPSNNGMPQAKKEKKPKESDVTIIEQKIAGLEAKIKKYAEEKPQLQSRMNGFQQQMQEVKQKIDNCNEDTKQLEKFKEAWLKEYVVEHLGRHIDKNVFAQLQKNSVVTE